MSDIQSSTSLWETLVLDTLKAGNDTASKLRDALMQKVPSYKAMVVSSANNNDGGFASNNIVGTYQYASVQFEGWTYNAYILF